MNSEQIKTAFKALNRALALILKRIGETVGSLREVALTAPAKPKPEYMIVRQIIYAKSAFPPSGMEPWRPP